MSEDSNQLNGDENEPKVSIYMTVVPKQRYQSLYIHFLMLGIASLMPFNSIIVPVDFWMEFYEPIFLSAASLAHNVGNWGLMFFMMTRGHTLSKYKLIVISLSIWLVCLIVIPLIHPIITNRVAKTVVTIFPILACGCANALFFPTVLAIGSKLSSQYSQALMAGQGIAGLIPYFILIIIKGIIEAVELSEDDYTNFLFVQTLVYFAIGALFIASCFYVLHRLRVLNIVHKQQGYIEIDTLVYEVYYEEAMSQQPKMKFRPLLKIMRVPVAAILLTFAITLTLFPTICVKIPLNSSYRNETVGEDRGWWSIIIMTVFMVFDYAGRYVAGFAWANRWITLKPLLIVTIFRIIFAVLFVLEALPNYELVEGIEEIVYIGGPIIKLDVVSLLTMAVFALTNGWTSSVIMMKFGDVIENRADQGLASTIQSFALNTGLFVGGLLSLGVGALIEK